jgi:hypothetical protein
LNLRFSKSKIFIKAKVIYVCTRYGIRRDHEIRILTVVGDNVAEEFRLASGPRREEQSEAGVDDVGSRDFALENLESVVDAVGSGLGGEPQVALAEAKRPLGEVLVTGTATLGHQVLEQPGRAQAEDVELADATPEGLRRVDYADPLDVLGPTGTRQVELARLLPVDRLHDVARVHVLHEDARATCHEVAVQSCQSTECVRDRCSDYAEAWRIILTIISPIL